MKKGVIALMFLVFLIGNVYAYECGNGIVEPGEACDGTNVNGYRCINVAAGFASGELSCSSDCKRYDVSKCVAGNTIYALNCSQNDVQSAVNNASDGDTVIIPAGECEWKTPNCYGNMNICSAVMIKDKSIHLKGSGMDKTIITNHVPYTWNNAAIYIRGQNGKAVRISDIGMTDIDATAVKIDSSSENWRIDHSDFKVKPGKGSNRYIIMPHAPGLIDNTNFTTSLVYVGWQNNISWNKPLSLGTANAVYIEDSNFYYGPEHGQAEDFTDCNGGARIVVRNNKITNAHFHCHGTDGGQERGTHSFEVYNNVFIDKELNNYRFASIRGGTGVMYDNSVIGDYGGLQVVHQRVCRPDLLPNCRTYPCMDQVGRTSDEDKDGLQDLSPMYEWNNKRTGITDTRLSEDIDIVTVEDYCSGYGINISMSDFIKEGRDYYNDLMKPGYVPYTYPHPLTLIEPKSENYTITYAKEDLNLDNAIDILDVVLIVKNLNSNDAKYDLNIDGKVNVIDLIYVIKRFS